MTTRPITLSAKILIFKYFLSFFHSLRFLLILFFWSEKKWFFVKKEWKISELESDRARNVVCKRWIYKLNWERSEKNTTNRKEEKNMWKIETEIFFSQRSMNSDSSVGKAEST